MTPRLTLIALALASSALSAAEYTLPTSTARPYTKLADADGATVCATWLDGGACDVPCRADYSLHRFDRLWRDETTYAFNPCGGAVAPSPLAFYAGVPAEIYSGVGVAMRGCPGKDRAIGAVCSIRSPDGAALAPTAQHFDQYGAYQCEAGEAAYFTIQLICAVD